MDYDKIKINSAKNNGDIVEYFCTEDFFSKKVYNKAVDYISGIDNWERADEGFYKQYRFSLKRQLDGHNHRGFNYIVEDMKLKELAQKLEEVYSCELKNFTQIRVQKQVKGDFIGSHDDGGWDDFVPEDWPDYEKYPTAPTTDTFPYIRLLWRITDDYEGGEFYFFDNFVLPKNKNSLIGFRTNRNSHHGVTEISSGERISILIDFWSSTQTDDEGESDYYFFR